MQEKTIRDILRSAPTECGEVTGVSRIEVELLLCLTLRCGRSNLHARPERLLTDIQYRDFQALLTRRLAGEPLAYVSGVKEFWSLPLKTTPAVLVPRPETELLVELTLARLPQEQNFKIADLGTGSGAIALAIARERPDCEIVATDISEAALAVARENAKTLEINNMRVAPPGDWFEPLAGQRFDVIVCNPPYLAEDDPHLDTDGVRFEPRLALAAGPDGLREIGKIIRGAGEYLKPGGRLIVEHGFGQGTAVRDEFQRCGFQETRSHRDLARLERATAGRWNRF